VRGEHAAKDDGHRGPGVRCGGSGELAFGRAPVAVIRKRLGGMKRREPGILRSRIAFQELPESRAGRGRPSLLQVVQRERRQRLCRVYIPLGGRDRPQARDAVGGRRQTHGAKVRRTLAIGRVRLELAQCAIDPSASPFSLKSSPSLEVTT
jgi:hypothetical protein